MNNSTPFKSVIFVIILFFFFPGFKGENREVKPSAIAFKFTDMTAEGMIAGNADDGGHGVAFVDVDDDGDLDIYVTNTPGRNATPVPNYLYINNGKGAFQDQANDRNVAGLFDFGAHGCVFADFDKDGDFDLIVANAGGDNPGQNRLFYNDGTGLFVDKTKLSGMNSQKFRTRGIAVGDFNANSSLDFVITNPLQETDDPPATFLNINRLYVGNNGKRFKKFNSKLLYTGFTQGITSGDVDGDGDLDLIESKRPSINKDSITNTLWLNDGMGLFSNASSNIGPTFSHDSPYRYNGNSLGDIDNDGDLDLITVSEEKIRLFRNLGKAKFSEITIASGLEGVGGYTASFGDLNNDGLQDIVIASGHNGHMIFRNVGNARFKIAANTGLFPPAFNDPRGMALGDYDDDGDLDIVIVHKKNIAQLFRNDRNDKKYIKLKLTSPDGERGAIGAKVWIYTAGKKFKKKYLLGFREVGGSTGYISQNSPEVHFGLKKAKQALDVKILFKDGSEVKLTKIKPGRTISVDFSN